MGRIQRAFVTERWKKDMGRKFSNCGESNIWTAAEVTCRIIIETSPNLGFRRGGLRPSFCWAVKLRRRVTGYHYMHCITTQKSQGCASTISLWRRNLKQLTQSSVQFWAFFFEQGETYDVSLKQVILWPVQLRGVMLVLAFTLYFI